MRPFLARLSLLCLTTVLGPGCLVNTTDPPPVRNPCEPNPCTQGDKTVCANNNGQHVCLCREGTVPRPSGACEPVSAANCPEHPGDASEPDDCLARAVAITSDTPQRQQDIGPVGDYDFFRVDATVRNVYTVAVQPGQGALLPRVDVFDQAGKWYTSQDGRPQVQLGFKALATGPYYVRVSHSPVDPSAATGPYTLSVSPPVQDDHGDASGEASSATVSAGGTGSPAITYGRLEYGRDEDWFTFPATTSNPRPIYRIEFNTRENRIVPTFAVFTRQNVKNPLFTSQASFEEFQADTDRFYLVVYSTKDQPGTYAFSVLEYR